tara:strand:- start:1070 stop:1417 length:348 start_codon:yes stop_codon:yes gene_type:complete
MRIAALGFALFAVVSTPAFSAGAVFMGLNKITARNAEIDITQDEIVEYGSLNIHLIHCQPNVSEQQGDGALVEITEAKADRRMNDVFRGWLFAGAPSLNAVQHPFYDLQLTRCQD